MVVISTPLVLIVSQNSRLLLSFAKEPAYLLKNWLHNSRLKLVMLRDCGTGMLGVVVRAVGNSTTPLQLVYHQLPLQLQFTTEFGSPAGASGQVLNSW
jgi:hypothetical protein